MSVRSLCSVCLLVALAVLSVGAAERSLRKPAKRPPGAVARTWTDSSGKHKMRATFQGLTEDGKAQLKRTDGKTIEVPLDRLSEADQTWIDENRPQEGSTGEAGSGVAASGAGDWPGWLGPNRDGKSADRGLLKEWPEDGPPLVWKSNVLGKGYSGVAVANGTVYITGEPGDMLVLHAFDMEGKLKWKVPCGPAWTGSYPGSRSTPTVDGANVYVLSGVGNLGCFDARNGKLKWTRSAKEFGGSHGSWGYAESVLILGQLAIFKPGGRNCIVALDKGTGRDVWASRGFEAGPEYSSCLAVPPERPAMVVTGTNAGIVAVDARSGAMLWANPFAARNTANCPTPAYSDGYVFWANGYGKGGVCLKLAAGGRASEAWTTKDMNCHHGGYVIHDAFIYGNDGGSWVCLDLKTGQKKWQERAVGKGSLCWADDMLYLFGEDGGRVALATCSPEGLKVTGQMKVEGSGTSWAHPVVAGGRLYLRYDTNLYCFDVRQK